MSDGSGFWLIYGPVIAAFLSAVATGFAAWAAIKGPASAARIAEDLRLRSEKERQLKAARESIFATLMQLRATPYFPLAVIAFNSIDHVFHNCRPVKNAWSAYYSSLEEGKGIPLHEQRRLLKDLLEKMANEIGLATHLTNDDFERVYIPGFIVRQLNVHDAQMTIAEQEIQSRLASANTAPSFTSPAK